MRPKVKKTKRNQGRENHGARQAADRWHCEYAEAMEWYYKAPSIQPASPKVLEYIVKTYIKLNQYQEGLPHLNRLIELLPDRTEFKTWLMHIEQGTMKSSAVSDVNGAD